MKKDNSHRHIPALAVFLILAAILTAFGGTLAIYSSQAFQRSVVRNRDTEAIRFSSDRLVRVNEAADHPLCYYPLPEDSSNTMTFRVCNYDQDKSTLYSEEDITYNISFAISYQDPDKAYAFSSYTIEGKNGLFPFKETFPENGTLEFTHTLKGGKSSYNIYTFTFQDDDYNNVKLTVTATPQFSENDPTKGALLKAVLTPIKFASTQGVTVRGEFPDRSRDNLHLQDFAAYNYLVSISGGTSEVTLTWNHTKVYIDPFFLNKVGNPQQTKTEDCTSITFTMDPEQKTDAYLIQFYCAAVTPQDDWADLGISVKLVESVSG